MGRIPALFLLPLLACGVPVEQDCADGLDNDNNGPADCADPACASTAACAPGDDSASDSPVDSPSDSPVDSPVDSDPPRQVSALTTGDGHNCVLWSDGAVSCWGDDAAQQSSPPEGLRFAQIEAGIWHVCGVTTAGELSCWGCENEWVLGQCDAPSGAFKQVAAGSYHACALSDAGEVKCWGCGGEKDYGQCEAPSGSGFVAIAAGTSHSCALDATGQASCWGCGADNLGQCDPPTQSFERLALGSAHSCGLTADGQVICWGRDKFGESSPPEGRYSSIATGAIHSCGVEQSTGKVSCWGCQGDVPDAQLGQCTAPELSGQLAVGAGTGHSCALGPDAVVTCWGCGEGWEFDRGQCETWTGQ